MMCMLHIVPAEDLLKRYLPMKITDFYFSEICLHINMFKPRLFKAILSLLKLRFTFFLVAFFDTVRATLAAFTLVVCR